MKKKLIALLLASSMALTGFVSVYGAEKFTDPGDGSAMESVTENEWEEGNFSDTEDGEFTSEESGDALFSDEKELPAVQNCKLRSNGMPVPLLRNGYSISNGTKYR